MPDDLGIFHHTYMDPITNLPQIILPGYEPIRSAVSKLNNKFPGIFKNVKEIRVGPSAGIGYVTNDPKAEGVIFLDFHKIKTQIASHIPNVGAEQDAALVNALAETIAHEVGHLDDHMLHAEFPAEEKARQTMQQLNMACDVYIDMIKKYC